MPNRLTSTGPQTGATRLLRLTAAASLAASLAACNTLEHTQPPDQAQAHTTTNAEEMQPWQGTSMPVAGGAPRPNPVVDARNKASENQDPPEPQVRVYKGDDTTFAPPKRGVAITGQAGEFNFEEAPITEVVHVMMGEILKADYVLHQPITGTLTLATRKAVSKDTALSLLETALLANGLLIAQDSRGFYHIGRPESLRGIVPAPRLASPSYGPLPPGYGIILLPLDYIGAAEMAEILKPVMGENSLLRVDTIRNLLVLAGTRPQAEGWMELVRTFDVDLLKGMSVGIFPLKYASVADVQAALQVVAGGTPSNNTGAGGAAAANPQQQARQQQQQTRQQQQQQAQQQQTPATAQVLPVLGSLRIVPLQRLNSLMVITPRAQYLEQVKLWIERLDQPNDSTEPQLFVYPVENGSAAHLAQVLGGIFGGQGAGAIANTGVAPGLNSTSAQTQGFGQASSNRVGAGASIGSANATTSAGQQAISTTPVAMDLGNARVIADPLNNAILVWGTRQEYEKIAATLKRLDKPPVQVMLEASIVEVTLTKDLQYGLRWAFNGNLGSNLRGTGGSASLAALTPTTAATSAIDDSLGAFTYAITRGNRVNALLQLLASRSLAKMLSSPSLLVLDNHTAAITVGDQIPVAVSSTSTINSNNIVNSYQYRDTGLILQITPSVNAGDLVTLTVEQTLSGIGNSNYAGNNPSFVQRHISSKVAVKSGEPIVLGGLIKENSSNSNDGIPGLVDVPVVRHAFGGTTQTNERTELLVIITPTVVRSGDELRQAGDELRDRMQELLRTRVQEIKRGGPVLPGEEDLVDLVRPLDAAPKAQAQPAAEHASHPNAPDNP